MLSETLLRLKGKTLVLTHNNADVDAVASVLVLAECLRMHGLDVEAGAAESISKVAQRIPGAKNILIDPDCKNYDNVILVETSVPEQLASVKNLRADFIIDHHPHGPLVESAKEVLIDENKKSCTQLVFSLLKEMKCSISQRQALILAAGIVADTAHFNLADLSVFKDIVELLEKGINIQDAMKLISIPVDLSERVACLKAARRMKIYRIEEIIVTISIIGSHEAAAARAILKMGADIAIVITTKDEEVRISSRGRETITKYGIDLSEIFKKVGQIIGGTGGGHPLAGSANGKNKKAIADASDYIIKAVAKKIGKPFKEVR